MNLQRNDTPRMEQYTKRESRRRIWRKIVGTLACIVVFCTTYALILPAITMENPTLCGIEEHVHSDACAVVCGTAEHTHSDACTKVCELSEHIHSTACGADCQTAEHTHDQVCTSVCGISEHIHSGDCSSVCGISEHAHSLSCYADTQADLESAELWEKSISRAKVSGRWVGDVLAIAKTQLGYTESAENYVVLEDGATVKGYTRYGDWYGDPYGDWSAMFAAFCLHYAGVEDMPLDSDCGSWIEKLSAADVDLYRPAGEHAPEKGSLVFFDQDGDGAADRVGLVSDVNETVHTIEGDASGSVQEKTYALDDPSVLGYALLPAQAPVYNFAEEGIQVSVELPADTDVPDDAVLTVTPIESDNADYAALLKNAQAAVDGEILSIQFYDISFYTADQEYIPVDDRAKVALNMGGSDIDPNSTVHILHYEGTLLRPTVLGNVSVEAQTIAAEPGFSLLNLFGGKEETLEPSTMVSFKTDGFSTFAVVEVTGNYVTQLTNILKPDQINDLDGLTLMISSQANEDNEIPARAVTHDSQNVVDGNGTYAQFTTVAVTTDEANGTATATTNDINELLWAFEAVDGEPDNDYYIRAVGTDQYLNLNNNASATLGGKQALFVVTEGDNANYYVFIQNMADDGEGRRRLTLRDNEDNTVASHAQPEAFADHFFLSFPAVETTVLADNAVTGGNHPLDGKTIAISTRAEQNGAYRGLTPDSVTLTATNIDGTTYPLNQLDALNVRHNGNNIVVGSDMLWEFIAIDGKPNTYYIRSVATGEYLKITTSNDLLVQENTDGGCEITVAVNDGDNGTITLRRDDNDRYLAYNIDENYAFATYRDPTPDDTNVQRGDLILSEYGTAETAEQYVTNLNGQTFAIVSTRAEQAMTTDDDDNGKLAGVDIDWANTGKTLIAVNDDDVPKAVWTFTAVDAANGIYHISAQVDGATKYLNIGMNTASVSDTKQNITVVSRIYNNQVVVGLRVNVNDNIYYLNDHGQNNGNVFAGFTETLETNATHFVLAQELGVDALVGPENDNYTGGVNPNTHVINTVQPDEAPGVKVSIFNYDNRVNTDEVSGGLANRNAYDAAVERVLADGKITNQAEVNDLIASQGFRFFQQAPGDGEGTTNAAYHDYYMRKYGSENNFINSFLLGGSVYDDILNYAKGYVYGEEQDVPFAPSEVIFDNLALTEEKADALSLNGAEDGPGPFWGWNVGDGDLNDDGISAPNIRNEVSVTLDENGYPVFVREGAVPNGSLAYLFNGTFREGEMDNGGGLFQIDEEGYYYYHSELNAAYYNDSLNQFTLYDHIVRPNYTGANEADDERGNFLPFDSLGTVNADGTVNWWTKDGNNNNDLDPTSFVDVNYTNEHDEWDQDPDKTPDDEHFYSPVIKDAEGDGIEVCSAALADTNLTDNWFGMMIEIDFYMPKDGTVNGKDMIFSFSGDDDVLVYVDDVLMINLGGIHGAQSGSINFTRGEFNNYDGYDLPDEVEGTSENKTFADRFAAAGKDVELVDGRFADYTKHTLKFFYMERGGNISHCAIRFNMPALPENSLTVTKDLDDSTGDVPDYIENSLTYTFRVIDATYDTEAYGTPYFREGTTFDILYDGHPTGRVGTVLADGTFTLKPNESARFTDLLENGHTDPYIVQELVDDNWKTQYSTVEVNGTEALTRPMIGPDGTTIYQTPEQIGADETNFVVFTNTLTRERSRLLISKAETQDSNFEEDQFFDFQVRLGGTLIPAGTTYSVVKIENGNETLIRTGTVAENAPGIVQAAVGETIVIDNLVAGVPYEVKELIPEFGEDDEKYAASYSGTVTNNTNGSTGTATNTGEIPYNSVVHLTVTNAKEVLPIRIPINKTIVGGYEQEEFQFEVLGTELVDGTWIDKNVLATASIKAFDDPLVEGSTSYIVFNVTPAQANGDNIYFKIREVVDPNDSYIEDTTFYIGVLRVTETDGQKGVVVHQILKNGIDDVTYVPGTTQLQPPAFVNTKTTSVTIRKNVTNGNNTDTFEFTVTATDKDGNPLTLAPSDARFTLKNGESKKISGLPIGAIVTVTETDRLDYKETFTMSATYEAEYGTVDGKAEVVRSEAASGGAHVGNIQGSANTVEIPVESEAMIGIAVKLWYASAEDRTFTVNFNGNDVIPEGLHFDTLNNGSWNASYFMAPADPNVIALTLQKGTNTIKFGGADNDAHAPNLDKIHLTFGSVTGNVATINLLGDDAMINFQNVPVTYAEVTKDVEGDIPADTEFTFSYTVKDVNGFVASDSQGPMENRTLTLKGGEGEIIRDVPINGSVEITETKADGYNTTYEIYSRYEAEDAELGGAAVDRDRPGVASNGKVVNNLGGATYKGSATFTVNSQSDFTATMRVYYDTAEIRSFELKVNDAAQANITCTPNGDWDTWPCPVPATASVTLAAGKNTIWIGNDNDDAPNLDCIDIVWQAETAGQSATHYGIDDPIIIHFTNEAGYELPETGGAGTEILYTAGCLLLMAAGAILLYNHTRRRKEDYASS